MSQVVSLWRYPVKGLRGQSVPSVSLERGGAFPLDRIYAIENGRSRFDPAAPKWLPKVSFLMLMRHERLAALETEFDAESHVLTIRRDGRQVARGQLSTKLGRQMIEQFLASFMATALKGPPRILSAEGHHFTDIAARAVHIVNLETVRAVSRHLGEDLHPLRFRANIYLDGMPAWQEASLVGATLRVGGVSLRVIDRTERCAAIDVDPLCGVRGISIASQLELQWSRTDLGVYATVALGGVIAVGDEVCVEMP